LIPNTIKRKRKEGREGEGKKERNEEGREGERILGANCID
jgi:hypothetical protein